MRAFEQPHGVGGSEQEVAPVCSGTVSAIGPLQAHGSTFTGRQGKNGQIMEGLALLRRNLEFWVQLDDPVELSTGGVPVCAWRSALVCIKENSKARSQ